MARLPVARLSDPENLRSRALLGDDGLDVPIKAVVEFIRRADSQEARLALMRAIGFPSTDVRMFLVVSHLALYGPLRPSDLADRIETGAANITKIVGRLEDEGLVGRMPDPADRRAVIVALTDAGARIGERLVANHREGFGRLREKWSDEQVGMFLRMLEDFNEVAADSVDRIGTP